MEKVKIKTCIDSGKKWNEKPIIEIELEDGRKGSAFDTLFLGLPIGQEIEVDMKRKDYNNEERYIFNIPNQKSGGKFQKDWTLEKRKISLECAITAIKITDQQVKTENIIALAEKFYEYLNKK